MAWALSAVDAGMARANGSNIFKASVSAACCDSSCSIRAASFSVLISMGGLLKKLMCVRAVSVFNRVARLFITTHRDPSHARLCGLVSPLAKYACHQSRSGLPGWAVGGVFIRHDASVI